MTTWQQINHWLKTMSEIINSPVDDYVFVEKEQKTIIDDNQSISSSSNSTIFDVISRDNTIQLILSYESHSQSICALKSISMNHLLINKNLLQQLHFNMSLDKCVLVLEESTNQILTDDDTQQPLSKYTLADNQPLHFRISIRIQILKYDNKQQLEIPISNRNITIKQILQLTKMPLNIYSYLASNITKYVISNEEILANLDETNFILVKENETCVVSIEMSNDLPVANSNKQANQSQRFAIFATISDVYIQNKIDFEHQYFLYSDDFIPSIHTSLTSFQVTSPIQFTVIDKNLPITITIINDEDRQSMKFNCTTSLTMKRVYQIASQLFNINNDYYQLIFNECIIDDDDDISLNEIAPNSTDVEFNLVCTATVKSSITYLDHTIFLPCRNETPISMIIKETLQKFRITQIDIDMYELFAIDEGRTQVDSDLTIEDLLQLFPPDITTIPFELKTKDD